MSLHPSLLATGFLLGSASIGLGQTFTHDDTSPYAVNTYRVSDSYGTSASGETISFNNATGKGGANPWDVNSVGLKETIVTIAGGSEVSVYDVCAELFNGPTGTSTYSVSAGFGSLNLDQVASIRALYSNALPLFITARDSLSPTLADTHGAALQIAFWEIVEETHPIISLDESGGNAGVLSVRQAGTLGDAIAAYSLAETWLDNVQANTWTDQGGLNYYYADTPEVGGSSDQDRFWVTVGVNAVPEPSSSLLAFFGLALAFRRRRD